MIRRNTRAKPPADAAEFENSVGEFVTPLLTEAGFIEVEGLWWGVATGPRPLLQATFGASSRTQLRTIGSRIYEAKDPTAISRRFPHLRDLSGDGTELEVWVNYQPEAQIVEAGLGPRHVGSVELRKTGGRVEHAVRHLAEKLSAVLTP